MQANYPINSSRSGMKNRKFLPSCFKARQKMTSVVAFVGAISLPLSSSAAEQLRLGHVATPKSAIGQAATRFAQHLARVSDNKFTVIIHDKGSLGGLPQLWAQIRNGALDFQVVDVGAVAMNKEARPLLVMWTPFLFRSQQHYRNYLGTTLFQHPIAKIEDATNIKYVGLVGERSPRVISTTNKPVRTAQDMVGLKMRIPASPIFVKTFKAWGAVPTPTKASEMMQALKTGMVDGQDNGVVSIARGQLGKVLKHVTPIDWARSGIGLWASAQTWNKLSDQQRQWIDQAVGDAGIEAGKTAEQELAESMAKLDELGITVTEPDLASFEEVTDQIVSEMEGKVWPKGQVGKIQAIK